MKIIDGVKFAATNCKIKYKNRDDLMLAIFDEETKVAGVFTNSQIVSPTITHCRSAIKDGKAKALIVNSGNANTFNGEKGEEIVQKTAQTVAKNLNCNISDVLISSTGVIGELFDYNLICDQVPNLIANANDSSENFLAASKAIMTTDLINKTSEIETQIDGQKIKIQGFAKGSGMIAPNMATMLAYVFTDAKISSKMLEKAFKETNEESFNSITVDSDCSTNDSAIIFATQKAGNPEIDQEDDNFKLFKAALKEVMIDLAKKIVKDGEGAKKLIKIDVIGAQNYSDAKKAAFSVANSPLVKSAIAASDPNWGRIIMAIGKSGAKILTKKLGLKIGESIIVENGEIHKNYNESAVNSYLKANEEVLIEINLGLEESAKATVYGCDLNEEYVTINKDYRT